MANSQPANTTISVFRTVRAQRNDNRYDAVKSILSPGLRPLVLVVPGEEVRIVRTYDTSFKTDRYFRGHPTYVNNRAQDTFADGVAGIAGLEIPVQIGRDKFITKDAADIHDDLHQEARDLASEAANTYAI